MAATGRKSPLEDFTTSHVGNVAESMLRTMICHNSKSLHSFCSLVLATGIVKKGMYSWCQVPNKCEVGTGSLESLYQN